jgi:hypothetical protein
MPDEDEEGNRVDPIPPTPAELLELPEDVRLYVSKRDWVRITVEEEHWDDSSPISGKAAGGLEQGPPGAPPVPAATSGKAPYSIVVSLARPRTAGILLTDTPLAVLHVGAGDGTGRVVGHGGGANEGSLSIDEYYARPVAIHCTREVYYILQLGRHTRTNDGYEQAP